MGKTATIRKPVRSVAWEPTHEGMYQVILHNDDHNPMGYVVQCLMRIFRHGRPLARKIMLEAHNLGRAVAEVEGEEAAKKHRAQLQSCRLLATVEKI